jgi:hypothetical protein
VREQQGSEASAVRIVNPARRRSSSRAAVAGAAMATALVVLVACPAGAAAAPHLAITAPASGSATNNTRPVFSGEIGPLEVFNWCETTVKVYEGATAGTTPVQTLPQTAEGECNWVAPSPKLEPGTYTAQASGTRWWLEGEEGEEALKKEELSSTAVTFRVDTTAPVPAIASPAAAATVEGSSLAASGAGSGEVGDLPAVTVQVFAGGEATGVPVEAIEAPVKEGLWSGTLTGLAPGSYTLLAQQTDTAGNVGTSAPVQVTVLAPPPPPPPSASFTSFPEVPRVGETVTLVSSSTDASSPIATFSWSLFATDPFHQGRSTTTTIFSSPGPHAVRLQVTDAAGRSAIAAKTINVRHQAVTLMQPFPIVRIAGRETKKGVKLTLVTVAAPISARVTVRIKGAGIRSTSESRLAVVGKRPGTGGTMLMSFPRFARSLFAGAVLEIRVTKAGEIGKLTRFTPRRGRLPVRRDVCLSTGGNPIPCPAS